MKAHTVFAGTEAHTAHVVCGLQTNNSLHQKHLRKQEELSVRKRLFTVPINHLRAHVHKQTDARHRKQETGHPPNPNRGEVQPQPRAPHPNRGGDNATAPGKHSGQRAAFWVVHFGCFKVPQISTAQEDAAKFLHFPRNETRRLTGSRVLVTGLSVRDHAYSCSGTRPRGQISPVF